MTAETTSTMVDSPTLDVERCLAAQVAELERKLADIAARLDRITSGNETVDVLAVHRLSVRNDAGDEVIAAGVEDRRVEEGNTAVLLRPVRRRRFGQTWGACC